MEPIVGVEFCCFFGISIHLETKLKQLNNISDRLCRLYRLWSCIHQFPSRNKDEERFRQRHITFNLFLLEKPPCLLRAVFYFDIKGYIFIVKPEFINTYFYNLMGNRIFIAFPTKKPLPPEQLCDNNKVIVTS